MPPEQPLRLIRAQDLTLQAAMAPPRDMTGWAVKFEVLDALGGSSVLSKTVGAGITISDAGKGVISITLAKADTSSLTCSIDLADGKGYVWNIKRTDAGSNVVLARGELILEREITS